MWIARTTFACAVMTLTAVGCGGKAKPPAEVDPPPVTLDLSKLGAPCGDAGECDVGSCAKYYGIAGPSGPEFASCEIGCEEGQGCPEGSECATIADGPGAVCRMPASDTVTE